jgi:hypothetical protein
MSYQFNGGSVPYSKQSLHLTSSDRVKKYKLKSHLVKKKASKCLAIALKEARNPALKVPVRRIGKYVISFPYFIEELPLIGKVSHVNSPDDFFITFDDCFDGLRYLNFHLKREYGKRHTSNQVPIPEKGNIIFTIFSCSVIVIFPPGHPFALFYQNKWYRVLIEEIISSSEVLAYLVDVGLRTIASCCQLRPIRKEM